MTETVPAHKYGVLRVQMPPMTEKTTKLIWTDEEIDDFLARTVGRESLPQEAKDAAMKYARAAIHIMRDGLDVVFADTPDEAES